MIAVTVSVGDLLAVGAASCTIILYFGKSKATISYLSQTIGELKEVVEKFIEADKTLALLGQRVGRIELDVKESSLAVIRHRIDYLETELEKSKLNFSSMASKLNLDLRRNANIKRS
jgi:hypothetical protein